MSNISSKLIRMMKKTACVTYNVTDSIAFAKALKSGKFKADIPGAVVTGVNFETTDLLKNYIDYLQNSLSALGIGINQRFLDLANWVEQNEPKSVREHQHPRELNLIAPPKSFDDEEADDEEEEEEEEELDDYDDYDDNL